MKVLIVCSGTRGIISPFIKEQTESLKILGAEIHVFQINKGGYIGYILNWLKLIRMILRFSPDMIHAHYGLSGFLANLQYSTPVITTFHGSDVNNPRILKWSIWAHRLSRVSIFVEKKMMDKFMQHSRSVVIPCGVDTSVFYPIPRSESRKVLNIEEGEINVLFSSEFTNPIKNYPLARKACLLVESHIGQKVNLIELKNLDRKMVNLYINASDCAVLLSSSEGSPQFVKEVMACNCPMVATDVGDISWLLGGTIGCYLTASTAEEAADKIILALEFSKKTGHTEGRQRILNLGLDSLNIAGRIFDVYKKVEC